MDGLKSSLAGSSAAPAGKPGQKAGVPGSLSPLREGSGTFNIPSPAGPGTPDSEDGGMVTHSSVTTKVTDRAGKTLAVNQHDIAQTNVSFVGARGLASSLDKDGGIHLRPLPASARKGRKIRTLVTFQARQSRFDRFNMESSKDGFRGFYTLFWIGMSLMVLNTFYNSYKTTGQILSLTFATLFSRDAKILAISDGILVGHLFLCVPFVRIAQRGWLPYATGLIYLQHLWQGAMLGAVIKWTHFRSWPWVQSGFFVLHTLAMMMKMHSYMAVNGNMADTFWAMRRKEQALRAKVLEVEAGVDAAAPRKKVPGPEDEGMLEAWRKACEAALGTGSFNNKWCSLELQQGVQPQRHRLRPARRGASSTTTAESSAAEDDGSRHSDAGNGQHQNGSANGHTSSHGHGNDKKDPVVRDPHPLALHPDPSIAKLASDIEVMREELISQVDHRHDPEKEDALPVVWPDNVTYANFWDYLLVPTLVYDLEFPRTKSIRALYVLEKVAATFGTFFLIYVITEHWIMPYQPGPDEPLLETFLQLAVPMMINYLLIFYIMFECICNAFAELTRFADREFYSDWWNATSMDVFSRRWNKPVHNFLLRHVYASSISVGATKTGAMFVTFLLSSLLHELVMAIVSGKIRGYLFLMQMFQLPLIALGQVPFIKRNEALGNLIFWSGLLLGFPMLNILYITY